MNFIKRYIHNWFFYTGLLFVVWISFFDKNSLVEQSKLSKTIHDLDSREQFYQSELVKASNEIQAYEKDTALLEKFAREKYYMKKDNEEVFVIVREETSEKK
jgi:cell division protein FtsB